jgi:ACS family hexuronate transporter-like MFS transporter
LVARTIKRLRWYIVVLAMLGTTINYLARSSLATAAPTLVHKLHMTTQDYSYVVAAFQLAYTVVQPVAGLVVDALGPRLGLGLFAIAWSLANMLHALATGWTGLAACRGLLGLSEGAVFPAGLRAISEWFPSWERSVAYGWLNVGAAVGGMLAPPLVVTCILLANWQTAFVVTGGIGLFWAIAWLAFYRRPQDHKRISQKELQYIESGQEKRPPSTEPVLRNWIAIMRRRDFWGMAIPRFLCEPAWQTFNFWIPLYLATVRHMSLKEIALFAWMPFLAADLGSVVGGYMSPLLIRYAGVSLIKSRKLTVLSGSLLMIGPALISLATNAYWAIALFCIGGFAHQMLSGALMTLATDLFPERQVASAAGLAGTAAWTGGLLFSLVVGALAMTIGYNPLFACLAVFDLLATIVVWSMVSDAHASATV